MHEIFSVADMGWNGKKNSELLKLMLDGNFDVLFTFDKNLRFQQNFAEYPISVLILNAQDNTYITLKGLVPKILKRLKRSLPIGPTDRNRITYMSGNSANWQ